ncbi:MAG: hypothetical protein ABFD52_10120 [Acidobacteriota bacterium]
MKYENKNHQSEDFFLDTSVQIERNLSHPDKRGELERFLEAAHSLCTSTYVKMEYRRSVIGDLVYLYNALIEAESFKEVLYRISNLPAQNHRRVARMLGGIAGMFEDESSEEVKIRNISDYAKLYFKSILENWAELFDKDFAFISDKTECFLAKGGPTLRGDLFNSGMSHCQPSTTRCNIVKIFLDNLDAFKNIVDYLEEAPFLDSEQERLKAVLLKAIEHPRNLGNRKECYACGDAVIAVECPDDCVMISKNEKHFNPICDKIGKKFSAIS